MLNSSDVKNMIRNVLVSVVNFGHVTTPHVTRSGRLFLEDEEFS
jgi:hypothetical protein